MSPTQKEMSGRKKGRRSRRERKERENDREQVDDDLAPELSALGERHHERIHPDVAGVTDARCLSPNRGLRACIG